MLRKSCLLSILLLAAALPTLANGVDPVDVQDPRIEGDYLEVRTADVWTGPCFANGEVNLTGREGMMAWRVERGQWDGVDLSGLQVIAVVRAANTLGDPFTDTLPAKSVILVDNRASEEQSEALVKFARDMGGDLLQDVVWTRKAPVEMKVTPGSGEASLKAGTLAEVRTRSLNHHDMHCGNEYVYYPPLTDVTSAEPAYALAHRFDGDGLGATWSSAMKRSAFVGTFAR